MSHSALPNCILAGYTHFLAGASEYEMESRTPVVET